MSTCCRHQYHRGRSSSARHNSNRFEGIPPAPPPPDGGEWELQYCKWSGWTWVKKDQREAPYAVAPSYPQSRVRINEAPVANPAPAPYQQPESHEAPRKKKNPCGCFRMRRKTRRQAQPIPPAAPYYQPVTPAQTIVGPPQAQMSSNSINSNSSSNSDDNHQRKMCCPYVLPAPICCCCCCCCCCSGDCDKQCCTVETQTFQEVKEQATKMSEMKIPKKEHCRKACVCVRPICCCKCVKRCCCCKNDCPKSNKETLTSNMDVSEQADKETNTKNKPRHTGCPHACCQCPKPNGNIVNYCLESNFRRNKLEDLKLKSTNLSILHKSLDILLKNNVNIMKLFDYNKEFTNNVHPISSFTSTQTITSLSNQQTTNPDPEHGKLLTAVCDAILASHKFDKEQQVKRRPKEKQYNFIDKILDDLDFSKSTNIDATSSKEVGIQVDKEPKQKRSFTKLVKNKSRVLLGARFPKKIDMLTKKCDNKANDANKNVVLTPPQTYTSRKEDDLDLGSIEKLLNSIDYATSKENSIGSNCSLGKRGDLLGSASQDDDPKTN